MTAAASQFQWLDDPGRPADDPTRPACWVIDSIRHPGHGATIVRQVLGMRLGVPASAVEMETDAFARPVLSGRTIQAIPGAVGLDFSLSHCPGILVIGVCSGGRIGVDAEVDAPAGWQATACDCLTLQEQRWLAQQAAAHQATAFLRLWTAKEAIAKALGLGVQADFAGIELEPRDGRLHVVRVQHSGSRAGGWALMDRVTPAGRGVVTVATIR